MHYKHYEDDYNLAKEPIARFLKDGVLKLILGAGISMDFGLTNWDDLIFSTVNACKAINSEDLIEYSDFKANLQKYEKLLNQYEKKSEFTQIVKNALYGTLSPDLENLLLGDAPGLLAIAALCTGTTRGRVRHIFTLNYDNILERYLFLLGLKVNSGSEFTRDNLSADVRIDHLHGYLPHEGDFSSHIVFSPESYRQRYATDNGIDDWFVGQWVGSKLLLIGLSGNDSLLQTNAIKHQRIMNNDEIYGYALLTPHAYEDNHLDLLNKGICPIKIPSDEIPKFLFGCCQLASA